MPNSLDFKVLKRLFGYETESFNRTYLTWIWTLNRRTSTIKELSCSSLEVDSFIKGRTHIASSKLAALLHTLEGFNRGKTMVFI